jgi:hypothetical protein
MRKGLINNKLEDILPEGSITDPDYLKWIGVTEIREFVDYAESTTVVSITGIYEGKTYVTVGVAKLSPGDQKNRKIGKALARSRAISRFVNLVERVNAKFEDMEEDAKLGAKYRRLCNLVSRACIICMDGIMCNIACVDSTKEFVVTVKGTQMSEGNSLTTKQSTRFSADCLKYARFEGKDLYINDAPNKTHSLAFYDRMFV